MPPPQAGQVHHLLAGQMIGQRLAFRLGADGNERRRIVGFGAHGIFGLAGLQLLELQFQLLDLTGDPLSSTFRILCCVAESLRESSK